MHFLKTRQNCTVWYGQASNLKVGFGYAFLKDSSNKEKRVTKTKNTQEHKNKNKTKLSILSITL